MGNLYQLSTEYIDLYDKLLDSADFETGEIDFAINQALEAKGKEFTEKAIAVANVYLKFDDELGLCEKRIKSLKEYKDKLEKAKKDWVIV